MRGLSVMEPWASLIMWGDKDVENRYWWTEYRGPLVICASAKVEPGWTQDDWDELLEERWVDEGLPIPPEVFVPLKEFVRPGYALGVVELVGIDREMKTRWDDSGQYHWRLADKVAFPSPFKQKGALKLYEVDDELVRQGMVINLVRK